MGEPSHRRAVWEKEGCSLTPPVTLSRATPLMEGGSPPTEEPFGRIPPGNPLARDVFYTYTPNDIGTKMTKNTGRFPGRTPHDRGTKMTKIAPQSRFPGQPAKNKRNPPKKAPHFCAFFYLVPLAL